MTCSARMRLNFKRGRYVFSELMISLYGRLATALLPPGMRWQVDNGAYLLFLEMSHKFLPQIHDRSRELAKKRVTRKRPLDQIDDDGSFWALVYMLYTYFGEIVFKKPFKKLQMKR